MFTTHRSNLYYTMTMKKEENADRLSMLANFLFDEGGEEIGKSDDNNSEDDKTAVLSSANFLFDEGGQEIGKSDNNNDEDDKTAVLSTTTTPSKESFHAKEKKEEEEMEEKKKKKSNGMVKTESTTKATIAPLTTIPSLSPTIRRLLLNNNSNQSAATKKTYHVYGKDDDGIPYSATHIRVDTTVTHIPSRAFYCHLRVEEIEIPTSVQTIGNSAFFRCPSLKKVKFVESDQKKKKIDQKKNAALDTRRRGANNNNNNKAQQSTSSKLASLGDRCFAECSELEFITLPSKLRTIGEYAFHRCTKLGPSIIVPSTVMRIPQSAFEGCTTLSSVWMNQSANGVSGVNRIGCRAFYGCTSLESMILPLKTLRTIDDEAFGNCNILQNILLPPLNAVTRNNTMGTNIFQGCTMLEKAVILYDARNQRQNKGGEEKKEETTNATTTKIENWLRVRFENLPLHALCYSSYSASGINITHESLQRCLLQQENDNNSASSSQDALGLTALHVLLWSPAVTLAYVEALLAAWPEANRTSTLAYYDASSNHDSNAYYPFHAALSNPSISLRILQRLCSFGFLTQQQQHIVDAPHPYHQLFPSIMAIRNHLSTEIENYLYDCHPIRVCGNNTVPDYLLPKVYELEQCYIQNQVCTTDNENNLRHYDHWDKLQQHGWVAYVRSYDDDKNNSDKKNNNGDDTTTATTYDMTTTLCNVLSKLSKDRMHYLAQHCHDLQGHNITTKAETNSIAMLLQKNTLCLNRYELRKVIHQSNTSILVEAIDHQNNTSNNSEEQSKISTNYEYYRIIFRAMVQQQQKSRSTIARRRNPLKIKSKEHHCLTLSSVRQLLLQEYHAQQEHELLFNMMNNTEDYSSFNTLIDETMNDSILKNNKKMKKMVDRLLQEWDLDKDGVLSEDECIRLMEAVFQDKKSSNNNNEEVVVLKFINDVNVFHREINHRKNLNSQYYTMPILDHHHLDDYDFSYEIQQCMLRATADNNNSLVQDDDDDKTDSDSDNDEEYDADTDDGADADAGDGAGTNAEVKKEEEEKDSEKNKNADSNTGGNDNDSDDDEKLSYSHVIVMPRADYTVEDLLLHHTNAVVALGNNISTSIRRNIIQNVAESLQHFHREGMLLYGPNLKPSHIVYWQKRYRLIDFNASVPLLDDSGNDIINAFTGPVDVDAIVEMEQKSTVGGDGQFSSALVPPEMIAKLDTPQQIQHYQTNVLNNNDNHDDNSRENEVWYVVKTFDSKTMANSNNNTSLPYEPIMAKPQLDVWSLGTLVYQLYHDGQPLFTIQNHYGNTMDACNLQDVYRWNISTSLNNKNSLLFFDDNIGIDSKKRLQIVDKFLQNLLATNPLDRYPTMTHVLKSEYLLPSSKKTGSSSNTATTMTRHPPITIMHKPKTTTTRSRTLSPPLLFLPARVDLNVAEEKMDIEIIPDYVVDDDEATFLANNQTSFDDNMTLQEQIQMQQQQIQQLKATNIDLQVQFEQQSQNNLCWINDDYNEKNTTNEKKNLRNHGYYPRSTAQNMMNNIINPNICSIM